MFFYLCLKIKNKQHVKWDQYWKSTSDYRTWTYVWKVLFHTWIKSSVTIFNWIGKLQPAFNYIANFYALDFSLQVIGTYVLLRSSNVTMAFLFFNMGNASKIFHDGVEIASLLWIIATKFYGFKSLNFIQVNACNSQIFQLVVQHSSNFNWFQNERGYRNRFFFQCMFRHNLFKMFQV